jgi:hypothetical protein
LLPGHKNPHESSPQRDPTYSAVLHEFAKAPWLTSHPVGWLPSQFEKPLLQEAMVQVDPTH